MALQKTKTIGGYDYNYWKITSMNTSITSNNVMVYLALYKDKDTRDADVQDYIHEEHYLLEGVDLTRIECYTAIKALPDSWFADAIDV